MTRITASTAGGMVLAAVMFATPGAARAQDAADALQSFPVNEYQVSGPNPLSERRTRSLLAPHINQAATIESLQAAAGALEQALIDAGFPFYRVTVPPQTVSDGVIELQITAHAVETITVAGNQFFSTENIRRSLPHLQVGESPNVKRLARDLAVANLHPGKRSQVTFSAAEGLEAKVAVRDQRTHQYYAWLNDTGDEETGETRLGLAAQFGNLFGRDHILTTSYTTSVEESDEVQQYAVAYQVPFYRLGGMLNLYAVRSDIDTGTVADVFDVSGRGDSFGAAFNLVTAKRGVYREIVTLGVDDKLYDNEVDFEGVPLGIDVRSRPLSLRYGGDWRGPRFSGSLHAGYWTNLSGGDHNDDEDYALTRAGAEQDWSAWRAGFEGRVVIVGRWELALRIDGQYANEPLIPGEQFGVGGGESLRGMDERAVTDDRGIGGSLELWTPQWGRWPRLLAFLDGARLWREDPLPGEADDDSVASAGLGLRWSWRDRLVLRLDWGYVLDAPDPSRATGTEDGDNEVHFNLLMRF